MSTAGADFRAELVQDNSTQLMFQSQELKEAGVDNETPVCGFKTINLNGNHTFDLNYYSEGANTAFIRRARIELWRIS